jgi:hypothetical protein
MLGKVGLWVVGLQLGLVVGLDNGVGVRPPLGWNSWNTFKGELTEEVVRDTAAHLFSSGLAARGTFTSTSMTRVSRTCMLYLHGATKSNVRSMAAVVVVVLVVVVRVLVTRCQHLPPNDIGCHTDCPSPLPF